jgi:hypothetical protein
VTGVLLITLLSANAVQPVKLAAPGMAAVNMPEDVGSFYSDHFAHAMTLEGIRVVTARQIQTLLGYERQKQLLGCAQDSSCMAELANALGVDGLITGQLGKFEDIYQLDVKIISATTGRVLSAYSGRASGEKKLLDELSRAAHRMAPELIRLLRRTKDTPAADVPVVATPAPVAPPTAPLFVVTPPPETVAEPAQTAPPTLRDRAWMAWTGGGAALVAGALFLGASKYESNQLTSGGSSGCPGLGPGATCSSLSYPPAQHAQSNEGTYQWVGLAFVGLAAVGAGVGGYMYFAGGPTGASVTVSGVFP